MLPSPEMRAARELWSPLGAALARELWSPLGAALVLVAAVLFFGGGSGSSTLPWIGGAAILTKTIARPPSSLEVRHDRH